jgi:predicted enzyme related to lactoylglutathione lyase
MAKANLAHVKLVVVDLDRAAGFYGEVCELAEVARIEDNMEGRPMREAILEPAHDGGASLVVLKYLDEAACGRENSVPVFFTDDLEALLARVERCGGTVGQRRRMENQGMLVGFWRDPEGNLVEAAQPIS